MPEVKSVMEKEYINIKYGIYCIISTNEGVIIKKESDFLTRAKSSFIKVDYEDIESIVLVKNPLLASFDGYCEVKCKGNSYSYDKENLYEQVSINPYAISVPKKKFDEINRLIDFVNAKKKMMRVISSYVAPNDIDTSNSNNVSIADELIKYKQLLDAGVLRQEEFETLKNSLISSKIQNADSLTDNLSGKSIDKADFDIKSSDKVWNFIDNLESVPSGGTMFICGDDYISGRGLRFPSKIRDVYKLYGNSADIADINKYTYLDDILFQNSENLDYYKHLFLKDAISHLEYSYSVDDAIYSIHFYFDSNDNLIVVGFIKLSSK